MSARREKVIVGCCQLTSDPQTGDQQPAMFCSHWQSSICPNWMWRRDEELGAKVPASLLAAVRHNAAVSRFVAC
jgi:hypothetical protein